MKQIKYFLAIFFTLALMGIASGCSKDKGAHYPEPSSFEVKPQASLEVSSGAGSIDFDIKAGNLGWWIEVEEADWIAPAAKYGSGDGLATLKYKANSTNSPRQAKVTFHPTMGVKPVTHTVTQK